jgi:hypothetical protein
MIRVLAKSIAALLAVLALSIWTSAQLSQTTLTGTLHLPTGKIDDKGELYLYEARKSGALISASSYKFKTDSQGRLLDEDGNLNIKVPRDSQILVFSISNGLNSCRDNQPCLPNRSNAVWIVIPGEDTVTLESRVAVKLNPATFGNPMTTAGDIIAGSTGGAPIRVMKGGINTVWGVNASGVVGYKPDPIGSGGSVDWPDITNKPTSFSPSPHAVSHNLNGSDAIAPDWSQVQNKPSAFTPSPHTHPSSQITDFASAVDARISYPVSRVFGRAGDVVAANNDYSWAQINKGTSSLVDITTRLYSDLQGIPSTFTPAAHNQAWSTITSTPTSLAGYGILDAQPLSSNLSIFAGITPSSNVQTLLGAATYAAFRSLLGLVIGTDVQAFSARLGEIASIGSPLQQIRVNAGGNALEYFTPSASGVSSVSGTSPIVSSGGTTAVISFDFSIANTWTANQTLGSGLLRATNPRITSGILDANGNSMVVFTPTTSAIMGVKITNAAAGGTVTIAAEPPAQGATTTAGTPLTIAAADALAGSSVDGAADGSSLTLKAGSATKRNTGNANGGSVFISSGSGVGFGPGSVNFQIGAVTAWTVHQNTKNFLEGSGNGGSVALISGSSTATTPVFAFVSDLTTGFGRAATAVPSITGNGVEFARFVQGRMSLMGSASANPGTSELISLGAVSLYVRGSKIVFAFNNGGTITYAIWDMTQTAGGSAGTWISTTSAP